MFINNSLSLQLQTDAGGLHCVVGFVEIYLDKNPLPDTQVVNIPTAGTHTLLAATSSVTTRRKVSSLRAHAFVACNISILLGSYTVAQVSLDAGDCLEYQDTCGFSVYNSLGEKKLTGMEKLLLAHEAAADPHPQYIQDSEKAVANGVATLDASGFIPITQLPPAAVERMVVVADQAARYALTSSTVQNGDTVKQADSGEMFYVVDDTQLSSAAGYAVYTAGTASSAPLSGITGLGTGVATALAVPTVANINAAVSDGDFATLSGTETLSNKTFVAPALGTPVSGVLDNCTTNTEAAGTNNTQLANTAFVFQERSATATLTNKTISLGSNTISGTLAQLNAAITDADVARTDAGQTFTGNQTFLGSLTIGDSSVFDSHLVKGAIKLDSAAISAATFSLPALSYVAACFHLAKDDTDKGAWRKRKGQSWRSEARSPGKYLGSYANATAASSAGGAVGDYYYNTTNARFEELTSPTTSVATYRAGKEDYPTNALITAEATRVIIWDLDGATPSMWMVFNANWTAWDATNMLQGNTGANPITSVSAIDGTLVVGNIGSGSAGGVTVVSFLLDSAYTKSQSHSKYYLGNISSRNNGSGYPSVNTGSGFIASSAVNSVAITVFPDAPCDEFGMPIPTIAAVCGNTTGSPTGYQVSVINTDGTVTNYTLTYNYTIQGVSLRNEIGLIAAKDGGGVNFILQVVKPVSLSNKTGTADYFFSSVAAASATNCPHIPYGLRKALPCGENKILAESVARSSGASSGATLIVPNFSNLQASLFACISTTHNTGWMVGATRRAVGYDSVSVLADKSIKASTGFAEVGTLTKTLVSGGRTAVSGFSAANYLQEASHADFNAFGTGDFSITLSGVKWGNAGAYRTFVSIGDGVSEGSSRYYMDSANKHVIAVYTGGAWTWPLVSSIAFTDTSEHTLTFGRMTLNGVASTLFVAVDGNIVASAVSTISISNATGYLRIGERQDVSQPWVGGQFSGYVRISATSPTVEQLKFIAAQENALNGGQPCLLSNSNSVSALSYNEDTDTYLIGNGTNVDTFAGLKRVASAAHGITTLKSAISAGCYQLVAGSSAATFSAVERNVAEDSDKEKPATRSWNFSASATTQKIPQGWKAQGVLFNLTAGTISTISQSFDGFVWTLSGLTSGTNYQVTLVENNK